MLCSRYKQFLLRKPLLNNNARCRCLTTPITLFKKCLKDPFLGSLLQNKKDFSGMSSIRYLFKDLRVNRLWSIWTRNVNVANVVRRCRGDRSVREVILRFRQAFFRPKHTLLLSATAACKSNDKKEEETKPCEESITDEDLKVLLTELETVNDLSKKTLYCSKCNLRLVIEKRMSGVQYCTCKEPQHPKPSPDGWIPFMEADDVIIWRKEYKRGQGLYAYKVYGRYKDVLAEHFAAIQVDGGYRQVWDSAVAALSVVERSANGVHDQAVLHWEVLWPRLFANRDYVYIRRHKEFDVKPQQLQNKQHQQPPERESVHSNAKRKSQELYKDQNAIVYNKAYVIVSRSCVHPKVPETKHAIRVSEYWSHMVVRTLEGPEKLGMEFVLTYYDEPAVGGMPSGVATWATGRAAPQYLNRMKLAAKDYSAFIQNRGTTEVPDFTPFHPETLSYREEIETDEGVVSEEDMESSKQGPDMEENGLLTCDQSTQTEDVKITEDKAVDTNTANKEDISIKCEEKSESEEDTSWWRQMYPFYYFV